MSKLTRVKSPTVNDFRYAPLVSTKTGIRLANLLPSASNKAIVIELVDAYITGATRAEYDALSYVWGTSERDKTIFCNGKRLQVTKTLIEALSRFRHSSEVVTLWIDQICICQERVKERNAQVQMMGDIFKSARRVLVWLGDDYDDSKAGMQLASQLLSIARQGLTLEITDLDVHGLPKSGSKKWKALGEILRRPWFRRTWIVQEVVLNPNVELVLGATSITWDELEAVVSLLHEQDLPFTKINSIRLRHQRSSGIELRRITSSERSGSISRPESRRLTSDGTVGSQISSQSWVDEPESYDDVELLDLLLMSRSFGATDPRDKIYALLGLGKYSIDPDYSMSADSVFTDFALTTIGEVTALVAQRAQQGEEVDSSDKEVRKAMLMLVCAGRQNQQLNLPSWVPDWTANTARPFMFQGFSAGGSRLGLFDWNFGLQLSGILFDTVQVAGVAQDHDEWWSECNEIATNRTVRSPGSSFNLDAFANMKRHLSLDKKGHYICRRRESLLDAEATVLEPGQGRVMLVSATGYVGLAPHGTKEGDLLFVILGCELPLVLRHYEDAFELIGEAYVQGIMHGEALGMAASLGVQEIMVK